MSQTWTLFISEISYGFGQSRKGHGGIDKKAKRLLTGLITQLAVQNLKISFEGRRERKNLEPAIVVSHHCMKRLRMKRRGNVLKFRSIFFVN